MTLNPNKLYFEFYLADWRFLLLLLSFSVQYKLDFNSLLYRMPLQLLLLLKLLWLLIFCLPKLAWLQILLAQHFAMLFISAQLIFWIRLQNLSWQLKHHLILYWNLLICFWFLIWFWLKLILFILINWRHYTVQQLISILHLLWTVKLSSHSLSLNFYK